MGIIRWIMLVNYNYGRHIEYVGKDNVILFWKVRESSCSIQFSTELLNYVSPTGFLRSTGFVLCKCCSNEDVSSLPVPTNFRRRPAFPSSIVYSWVSCHGLLDCMHHSRVYRVSSFG